MNSRAMFSRAILFLLFVFPWHTCFAGNILILGDSLSAGYGLPRGSGWVNLLTQRLQTDYPGAAIVNASISGETTAGGKRRIDGLLERHKPDIVIVELGANDGLRGIAIPLIRDNLSAIATACRQHGARTLIVGMRIPPNYGRDYGEKFHALFQETAKRHGTSLVPFLLEGFADDRTLFQDDGIHPANEAQPLIMENVFRYLKQLL